MSRYKELREHVGHKLDVRETDTGAIEIICDCVGVLVNRTVLEHVDKPVPTLKIRRDTDAESPREYDNLSVIACWHRCYSLGDVQPKESPEEWLQANAPKGSEVMALYIIDHFSGIALSLRSFNDPWDSGRVGTVVMTPDKIFENFGKKGAKRITAKMREKAREAMSVEVRVYDAYLRGDVWGFEYSDVDEEDSCWGFIGSGKEEVAYMVESIPERGRVLFNEAWNNRQ